MFANANSYFLMASGFLLAGGGLFIFSYVVYSVLQEFRADRVPALLYHRLIPSQGMNIGQATGYDRSYVTFDTAFAEQMAHLYREGYTTISLDDFLAYREGLASLPPKPIIITFDDGFASNYHYAFPILKKYGMTATIFVTPDRECENFKKNAPTDSPLSDEQMCEMSENRISIQSHGMTHRYLTELEPEVMQWELTESRSVLERLIGKPVLYLAIPSGAYNKRVKKSALKAGYKAVFCMLKGSNNQKSDLYALRRFVIGRDFNMEDFRRTLRPATACYIRLASSVQNALLFFMGPGGLDGLRNVVYRSGFGSVLVRGQLKYLVPGVMAFLFFTLLFGSVIVLQWYF